MGSSVGSRSTRWRTLRTGVGAISLATFVALPIAPSALAAPDAGSSGSASGSLASGSGGASSDGGSVSAGSTIPGPLQNEHPPLPALRDDITTAAIVGEEKKAENFIRFTVASPALRRNVGVEVILPRDSSAPRPSIYALEGVDAGEDSSGWADMGGALKFFADKNVNVVMPNGGVSGIYTDWDRLDPGVGLHKWETFITRELPPLLDARLKTNGVKALMGASMGAQGAMMLATRHPEMYRGIAVFSGCYSTTDDLGRLSVLATVSSRGGDPANVWGDFAGPEWAAHDALRNAETLRGKDIYVSVASGLPGRYDTPDLADYSRRVVVGGSIEAAANACTRRLQSRLRDLKIPATFDYEPSGTHAWIYWENQLPKAWPTLARSLGLA
ncbi:alpha/beta hydrolase [Rhodococcus oryzae]|uniref:alpha/beta hydrolase n=1 Tax=Rhodococcus oryzae TaxID=2571143 RepID=UPI00371A0C84